MNRFGSIGHVTAAATLAAALAVPFAPPATAAPASPHAAEESAEAPPFPILDEIDRRLREQEDRQQQRKRQIRLNDIQRLIQLGLLRENPEERVLTLLKAERYLVEMAQQDPAPEISTALSRVRRRIVAEPPPRAFRTDTGLEMVLAEGPNAAFYIARHPVRWQVVCAFCNDTGRRPASLPETALHPSETNAALEASAPDAPADHVTMETARAIARWISTRAGAEYRLPTIEELRRRPPKTPGALWTRTEWNGPDDKHARLRNRYAVQLYELWDPKERVCGRGPTCELPFAHYETLGFVLVTDLRTGVEHRIRRLRSQL